MLEKMSLNTSIFIPVYKITRHIIRHHYLNSFSLFIFYFVHLSKSILLSDLFSMIYFTIIYSFDVFYSGNYSTVHRYWYTSFLFCGYGYFHIKARLRSCSLLVYIENPCYNTGRFHTQTLSYIAREVYVGWCIP